MRKQIAYLRFYFDFAAQKAVKNRLTTLKYLINTRNWLQLIEVNPVKFTPFENITNEFTEVAKFNLAADYASSASLVFLHLKEAEERLYTLEVGLLNSWVPHRLALLAIIQIWKNSCKVSMLQASQRMFNELPSPFIIGNPIYPDTLFGSALFRGRERIVAQVEQMLGYSTNHTMALIGPRRCGKSSLLNLLPILLPTSIVVKFDLQDNPADTPMRFYQGLARVAQSQARRSHDLELPDLDDTAASPIEALKQWFEQLENFSAVPRILLCIDEFERLETLFPDKERELPQFMGVIRATIQHKRRLRLLVAGAAPFADLGPIWNDHFINLREIKIGYFDHATATGLLTKPMPEFPDGTISQTVADEVFARSKGQPFLTQAYGHGLVNILNEEKRKQATLLDLEQVEAEILQECTYYFRSIWQEVPPAGQAVLEALAHGQPAHMDTPTRLWLRRRMVITDDQLLVIPLFGRWIREKDLV